MAERTPVAYKLAHGGIRASNWRDWPPTPAAQKEIDRRGLTVHRAYDDPREQVVLVCPNCGSPDICRDAAARWNIDRQEWQLAGVQDTMTCQVCDRDFEEAREIAAP